MCHSRHGPDHGTGAGNSRMIDRLDVDQVDRAEDGDEV